MRALAALLVAACAPITATNIEVRADGKLPLRMAEIDRAVAVFDDTLGEFGLMQKGDASQLIASRFLLLRWKPAPFRCDLPGATSEMVMGCNNGHEIEVVRARCIGDTVLLHELTHVLLTAHNAPRVPAGGPWNGDPDADHVMDRWWQASDLASQRLASECAP